MKQSLILFILGAGLAGAPAQDIAPSRHHVGIGFPVWLKARAAFTGVRATDPGAPTGAFVERFYDDGFNRVDSSTNAVAPAPPGKYSFPRTAFFGFQSRADQVRNDPNPADSELVDPQGGTLSLHSFEINGGDYTRGMDNQPFPGLEVFYRYDLKATEKWSLGFELGAAYNYFRWERSGPQNATVDLITDVFSLGGTVFNTGTDHVGLFDDPLGIGPPEIIGSTPAVPRGQATVPATVTGNRALDLHALQFRLGPTLDWKPNARWELGVQAGLALGVGFSQLDFAETIAIAAPNTPAIAQRGSTSDIHHWVGLFSAFRVNRQLNEKWTAHVEVRHMWMETLHHNGPLRSGAISLSDGLGVAAGLSYRF